MYAMDELKEMLCRELDEIAEKQELSAGDLETVQKLTDSIKNLYKIEMLEDDGYSRDGEWKADMRGTYGRGNSYGKRHYVKAHYSRDNDRIIDRMERIMQDAPDKDREIIRRCMEQLSK